MHHRRTGVRFPPSPPPKRAPPLVGRGFSCPLGVSPRNPLRSFDAVECIWRAWWSLPSDKQTESLDHFGRGSQQSQRAETTAATELLPRHKGEGRLLRGSRPGVEAGERINETGLLVRLVDMSQIDFG